MTAARQQSQTNEARAVLRSEPAQPVEQASLAGLTETPPLTLAAVNGKTLLSLAINDVLNYNGKVVRLIAANPQRDIVFVIELDTHDPTLKTKRSKALPYVESYRHLRADATRIDDPCWARPLKPSAAAQVVRDARHERIRELVVNPGILLPKTRGPLLAAQSEKVGVSKKTLLDDLRTWWQRGQVIDALLGDYHRSGRVRASTPGAIPIDVEGMHGVNRIFLAPAATKARGRRPKGGHYTPVNLSEAEKLRIVDIAGKRYSEDSVRTIGSAAVQVMDAMYALKDAEGKPRRDSKGNAQLPPLGFRPTVRQVHYLLKTTQSASKTYAKRHGTADYLNNFAPATGTVFDDCIGPGDVYECDDTTFDFHVVADSDPSIILGKVTLHVVVDRHSRLIVGFHLSLDASCWEDAKLALLSTCNDWEALCKKHGLAYYPEDFPAQGVICNRFFTDRGPFMTFASDEMSSIGNEATTAPARASRAKPIIESTFRRTNGYIKELPGHEPQWNVQQRQRKKYEKSACLKMSLLECAVLRSIISLNREILKDYVQCFEDVQARVLPIPRENWARDMERLCSLPRRVSRDWLRRTLLSADTATVTQQGIRFNDSYYVCKEAIEKDWIALAALKGEFPVTVLFTPKNLDVIRVQDPHDIELQYVAKLTTKSERAIGTGQGLTDLRVKETTEWKREVRRLSQDHNMIQKLGYVQDMSPAVTQAFDAMREATKGKTLASRKNTAPEEREAEADALRKVNHRVTDDEVPDEAGSRATTESELETPARSVTDSSPAAETAPALQDPNLMNDFLNTLKKL